jgi:hypothetical protein
MLRHPLDRLRQTVAAEHHFQQIDLMNSMLDRLAF